MQYNLFPNNTRSNFECHINEHDLSYICKSPFEVGIKSITFENDLELYKGQKLTLGLKSNITNEIISSCGWDNIICLFTISDEANGILQFDFKNPTFYASDVGKLSKARFTLIDTSSNKIPFFDFGSPTFIEVIVRSQDKTRMKLPFSIMLDSSCTDSKKLFPENSTMEFTIQLPQRMVFERENWMVALKSIHLTNKLLPGDDFWLTIVRKNEVTTIKTITAANNTLTRKKDFFTTYNKVASYYLGDHLPGDSKGITDNELINILNRDLKSFLFFSLTDEGKIKMYILESNLVINLSERMKLLMGFVDCTPIRNIIIAQRKPRMHIILPKQFLVTSNICDESIIGDQCVKILKYFSATGQINNDYEFLNNDYVKLSLKNFDRIKIRISDLSGNLVKCETNDIPTQMILQFVNIDSK